MLKMFGIRSLFDKNRLLAALVLALLSPVCLAEESKTSKSASAAKGEVLYNKHCARVPWQEQARRTWACAAAR